MAKRKQQTGGALPGIKFDAHNFRKHSAENKKMIHDSLAELGAGRSVVVDKENELIAGNGVYEQAQKLGMPVRIVETDGTELVVVKRTDLATDDAKRKKLAAADNAIADNVEWNAEELRLHLDAPTIEALHIELPAIKAGGGTTDENSEPEDEQFDAEKVQTRVQPGDVWQLGKHRVCCGDSTNAEDVAKLFGGAQPFAIVTDPPYCSGGFQESGKKSGSIGTRDNIMIANDTLSTRGYMSLIKNVIERAGKCAMVYVFTDWRMFVNLFDTVEASGFGVRNMIVWDKGTPGMGVGWRSQHEVCLFGSRSAQKFNPHLAQGNVIQCKRTGNVNHPTEKPVELLYKILRVSDMATDIYDPFSGSGTTLIACEQLENRRCFAMELDPHYCDVIISRWEQMTGQTAVKL